jgi:4-aminobutyrate aminotransferase-like enzyme
MCLGKAMGGGVMPIGAVLGTEAVMGSFDDVPTGSTWAWLPASCAVALRTLEIFEKEEVLANVRALHEVGVDRLSPLVGRYRQVGDVRVQGCFMALDFVKDSESLGRAPDVQEAVARAALERGVLTDSSTTTLNIQPSLVMSEAALAESLDLVCAAVSQVLDA